MGVVSYLHHIRVSSCTHYFNKKRTMSFIQNFVARFVPIVKADDEEAELVDPQKVLRESCAEKPNCVKFHTRLTTCNDRVNSRKATEETCLEELIDYVSCVDHCVSHDLFSKLK
ncbi:hypothetical protein PV327_001262 [Microctonus hyperodae]|uniref:Ubiquinol-cytochrome C reductase hinge domain-containing protein n=1 Tax=Microctonus hyperodae TaxID=165561 RepID=A0AA39G7V0_MICHY|nr:hypothetical protein PV327_001262 [Microctonus hyperodae]